MQGCKDGNKSERFSQDLSKKAGEEEITSSQPHQAD
jgi:hypothetical protein